MENSVCVWVWSCFHLHVLCYLSCPAVKTSVLFEFRFQYVIEVYADTV